MTILNGYDPEWIAALDSDIDTERLEELLAQVPEDQRSHEVVNEIIGLIQEEAEGSGHLSSSLGRVHRLVNDATGMTSAVASGHADADGNRNYEDKEQHTSGKRARVARSTMGGLRFGNGLVMEETWKGPQTYEERLLLWAHTHNTETGKNYQHPIVYFSARGNGTDFATVNAYVKDENDPAPMKFKVRAKSWGTPKMLTFLSSCGLHGEPYVLLNGYKNLNPLADGIIENFASMSDTGYITMHADPQPLPENMELFREKMVKWHGAPKVQTKWIKRTCQYDGCSNNLTGTHRNTRYCPEHAEQVQKERNAEAQRQRRAQTAEPLPWDE